MTTQASVNNNIQLQTETVRCGCCGASDGRRLFTERYTLQGATAELGINRCSRCELIYVSPRLDERSTRHVYEFDAEHTISHNYCWDGSISEQRFGPLLKRLAKLAQPGKLLDVGCGGGHFLQAAKKLGLWQLTGLEPISSAAVQAANYTGCEVQDKTLDEADFAKGTFEVITMLGVLEHLHDPQAAIVQARKLMTPSGMLGIYVPNYNYLRLKDTGLLSYVRNRRWSKLHPQEHLFQFQPATLRRLLESAGFEIVRLDMGKPFMHGPRIQRLLKQVAYQVLNGSYAVTGLHFGGLEVIARIGPKSISESTPAKPLKLAS